MSNVTVLKRLLAVLVAVLLVAVPASIAQGAPGGGGGPPEGVGNRPDGVGGGRPDNAGSKKGDIYADLMVIARHVDGTPITVSYTIVPDEGDEEETHVCVQPITTVNTGLPVPGTAYPTFGYDQTGAAISMFFVPLVGDEAVALDMEPCDVAPGFTADETDLGRLNLGRAPERVLTKQLGDVTAFLQAPGTVGLDASGRFTKVVDGVVVGTLDSPLANMAAMQSILETGRIGGIDVPEVQLTSLELAAAQLAAAAPKEDAFDPTVDVVQYLGRILRIPQDTEWSAVTPVLVGDNYLTPGTFETFLNFSTEFTYDRAEMFPGCIHYYDPVEEHAQPLMSYVFGDVQAEASGIEGYTQLAADAREVLVTIHDLGITVLSVDDIRSTGAAPCVIED